ncbi:MAG: carboxypeptidase regulatory-like domain-containing protein [Anaerolineae bacterium]|nr:carboxypeptidase regulatory-like domain-containing protein [Anaerolineae bacterium]
MPKLSRKQWLGASAVLIGLAALFWLVTTDNPWVWPYRNTLQYHTLIWWWQQVGYPQPGAPGVLRGTVRDAQDQPLAGAWVLVSWWDGTTYSARSEADGRYTITGLPAGQYRPVAGTPGYENVQLGGWGWVTVEPGAETGADITLPAESPRIVTPGVDLNLGEPQTLTCTEPFETQAVRRRVNFDNNGQPNQSTLFYTPVTTTAASGFPTLLAIYPGPADSWECASLPLAAAGYAIVAIGPAYNLDLEADIDELERLVSFIRAGQFPGSDGSRLALLGGSYSSLHVQRLLERNPRYEAAVLLGPPTDLFDMRRRLEERTYIPPFGLDQVLIALGLPDRAPMPYWRYSSLYHLRPDLPPLAIMHSRTDEVVPFQQSELLSANLDKLGVAHQAYFFDGGSHYLLAEGADKDTRAIYRITLEFLAEHLR